MTKLNDILNNTKVIKSKRQPNNLKQILTHAKFSQTNNDENYEVKKCNDRRCKVCEILIEGKVFKFKNCHTEFEVKRNFTCNSKNVVYVIQCDRCKEEYIGSTQQLNHRVALHKTVILKIATPLVKNRVAHILSFLKSTLFIFLNIFLFNTPIIMSPSCSVNNFDLINDMYSFRTFIVMPKVSFFSCRSIYKDFIVGIIQCARATSPVEMCFIFQPYTNNELSGLIRLN